MSCPCRTCMQIKICPITSRANFKKLADNMHHKKLIYFFNRLFFKVLPVSYASLERGIIVTYI